LTEFAAEVSRSGFQYISDPDPAVERTYTALVGLFGA
jgi:hypothetical protein